MQFCLLLTTWRVVLAVEMLEDPSRIRLNCSFWGGDSELRDSQEHPGILSHKKDPFLEQHLAFRGSVSTMWLCHSLTPTNPDSSPHCHSISNLRMKTDDEDAAQTFCREMFISRRQGRPDDHYRVLGVLGGLVSVMVTSMRNLWIITRLFWV